MVTCKLRFCAERKRVIASRALVRLRAFISSPLSQVSHFNNRFSPILFSFPLPSLQVLFRWSETGYSNCSAKRITRKLASISTNSLLIITFTPCDQEKWLAKLLCLTHSWT